MNFLYHNWFGARKRFGDFRMVLVQWIRQCFAQVLWRAFSSFGTKNVHSITHAQQTTQEGLEGSICIVYITCINGIIVPTAYLSILYPSLYQSQLDAREFFKYQLSCQFKILLHKKPSWYLSSRSDFHRLKKIWGLYPFVSIIALRAGCKIVEWSVIINDP